jgi:hypothetical protein
MILAEQTIIVERENTEQQITVEMESGEQSVSVLPEAITITGAEPYEGTYDVTPTQSEQILYTDGLRMTDNVRIAPIPSNYGLITWNGSILTVS